MPKSNLKKDENKMDTWSKVSMAQFKGQTEKATRLLIEECKTNFGEENHNLMLEHFRRLLKDGAMIEVVELMTWVLCNDGMPSKKECS